MATNRITMRLLAGGLLTAALGGTAAAQTKPEQVLGRQPTQPNVQVSTPATPAEVGACRVEVREWGTNGAGVKPKGVVLTDGSGRKLRQFIDTAGGNKPNIFSYYVDGVEAYREVDSNGNGKPDSFRWLGVNGGKQGLDKNEDGVIDQWVGLSAEELTQELFAAIQGNDKARYQALLLTDDDLKALKLPQEEEAKLRKKLDQAAGRLAKANADLKLGGKAKWMHAELNPPHTTPRDALGTADDLVRHKNVAVLVDAGDGKTMTYFSTGELVQVGKVWRVVDGPSLGTPVDGDDATTSPVVPDAIREIVDLIGKVKPPAGPADTARYHLERAALLEKCVVGTQGAQQMPWLKQMIDAYAAGVESAPDQDKAFARFTAWKDQILQGGAAETKAYAVFRYNNAEYAVRRKDAGTDNKKVMAAEGWRKDSLEKFVKDFPESADAPEAVMQLAVAAEFGAKDPEAMAKGWYEKLMKDYTGHPHAAKAAGAIRRLGCEGKPFELSGETLDGRPFSEKQLAGKPAVVLYWASWGSQSVDELKALAKLEKDLGGKVQVLTISLDDDGGKADAAAAVKAAGAGGYHLHAGGGLDRSPLATAYGVHMIPQLFLIDKDGKVANRNAQPGPALKDDVEKLVK
jgi:cytochrome oxidase Cu insertion factor (SCO1/SenC/PrrC family)